MIKINVTGLDAIQKKLDGLSRGMQPKVIGPAINKVAEKARAEINRAIPQEFNVKATEVRNAIDLRRANSGRLEAVISVFGSKTRRGRSMNMIHFLAAIQAIGKAIKTRGGKGKKSELAALQKQLGFLIKKGGGLKKIEGAFVGNKGRTIFMREGKARLPIKPVQVIGIAQMFRSKRIEGRVMKKIQDELPIEVDRAIKRLLG